MSLRLIIVNASHTDEYGNIQNLLEEYFSGHAVKNNDINLITGNDKTVIQKINQKFKDYIYNYDELLTLEYINKFCLGYDEVISLNSQEIVCAHMNYHISKISFNT